MRSGRFGGLIGLAAGLLLGLAPAGASTAGKRPTPDRRAEAVVLQFAEGKAVLSGRDRSKIRHLPVQALHPGEAILVVGYTDTSGSKRRNYALSYARAQAVRRIIIETLGVAPDKVLAIGRGSENPVAHNSGPQGRAENRRVEILRVRLADRRWKDMERPLDAKSRAAIEALVHRAQKALRCKRLQEALKLLQQARARGGARLGIWQSVYGIGGYYAHAPFSEIKAHLTAALRMNPFDRDARDYLGRAEARDKVRRGLVTADMGRSEHDAIAIDADAQAYEYLRLFQVQPLSRAESASAALMVWTCRDARGRLVHYYFDRSKVLAWLFTAAPKTVAPHMAPAAPAGPAEQAENADTPSAASDQRSAAPRIWNSRVFKAARR